MQRLTGREITSLMRRHGKSILGLAADMNVTQVRVRTVRDHGVEGSAYVALGGDTQEVRSDDKQDGRW